MPGAGPGRSIYRRPAAVLPRSCSSACRNRAPRPRSCSGILSRVDSLSNMPEAGFVAGTQEQRAACRRSGGIEIRQAGRADAEAIRSFITGLSPRTQYRRFFAGVSPPSSALLRGLCGTGNGADIIVAARDSAGCGGLIVGHAMSADSTAADGWPAVEVSLEVDAGSQPHGIG